MNKVDIVFNFDTTGSMYPCLSSVRQKLESILTTLFKEVPDLRIGVGANGDYSDLKYCGYTTLRTDLTNELHPLVNFVRTVKPSGGGGNGGEAYELVLREAKRGYSWRSDAQKILVMIGDEVAHTTNYHENRDRIDWRREAADLRAQGIEIYTVQCLDQRYQKAHEYYPELAAIGGGYYLRLDQFADIVEIVMAITYRTLGVERVEQYEQQLAKTRTFNRALDRTFNVLTGRTASVRFQPRTDGLVPVAPGRFQVFRVDTTGDIRKFVDSRGIAFKAGRGFYEFTKREEIQEKKEVVLRDRVTGDMFSGDEARNIIGLPAGQRGMLKPDAATAYQVFVQSTSYNRKLIEGTDFLYEVDQDA